MEMTKGIKKRYNKGMNKFKIGLFTSAWDKVAWDLVKRVYDDVESGLIPNAEISFVFVSREIEETDYGDLMINNIRKLELPLITFSSARFKPELRNKNKTAWQLEHGQEVQNYLKAQRLISPTDLDVLLGYMWTIGKEMCQKRIIINLHPALPTGPKGTYREVIWQLIKDRANETGVMIHLVTEELDTGSAIAFCRFPIKIGKFAPFWREMEERLEKESLEQIAKKEGENNSLFRLIRREGVIREFLMITWTIKALAEGKIKIKDNRVIDSQGQILENGYDLTSEIERIVKEKNEKEV